MELKNTIEMMISSDYKERFKAEYYQLRCLSGTMQELSASHPTALLHCSKTS